MLILCCALAIVGCQSAQEIKRQQYFVEGLELYKIHCANCHQPDGKGLANLYPPIAASDYLAGNQAKIICGIRYGMSDTLLVNQKTYTQAMPANAQLKNIEIAQIMTFIYNKWGGEQRIYETNQVKAILETCKR